MKTAKEILYETATKYDDGFLSGQVRWIIDAMELYADELKYENEMLKQQIKEMTEQIYKYQK